MATSELVKVCVHGGSIVPFLDECGIQVGGSIKEVMWVGAGNVESVQLTGDHSEFAVGGQLGFRVWKLIQFQAFAY